MQQFDKLFLLSGRNFRVNKYITVRHPTISEIVDIGEGQYHALLNPFVTKPEDYMVEYDDAGINYMNVDPYRLFYEIFKYSIEQKNIDYEWILGCSKFYFYNGTTDEPAILNNDGDIIINKETYHAISNYLKQINNYSLENKYNPSSELTRKMIIQNERDSKDERKQDSQLANLISAVSWKNTSGINILNVWDLHIYQFINAVQRISSLDKYHFTMQGIYSGCINSKSISKSELDWTT